MQAEVGSGISVMSDSLIAFHPAIDEPSNIWPSEKVSSSMSEMSNVTCCHLPRGSVKRKSAYFTSLSLISLRTSFAVVMLSLSLGSSRCLALSDCVEPGLAGPDSNGFLYLADEDFTIADAAGLGGATNGVDRLVNHVVAQHD